MGEVYRARDTKLKRDVALKVLPAAFANDPDRMARFQREAEVLASLNHPNIAHLYGIEERALVMELVEGENLKGPLPVETALNYAKQIADALEYAHERGVIHRDLKPANVMITPAGVVKVLDFGLAKAIDDPGAPASAGEVRASNSPTLTMGATRAGMILGTAAYMSPEQATGRTADSRADIWSFGVLLYEMLTGRQLFAGESTGEVLASVIKEQPDLSPAPAQVRRLLKSCLEKDRKNRLQAIGDWRLALEPLAPFVAAKAGGRWVWPVVAVALLLALTAVSFLHFRETPAALPSGRFDVALPLPQSTAPSFSLSPDGRTLAFTSDQGGPIRVWVRPLDSIESRPLPGTDGATYPFWSPDNANLGFFAQGKLKKIALAGGPAQTLCDAPTPRGGAWNRDGVIIFGNLTGSLLRVSDEGGAPAPITKLASSGNQESHRYPEFILGSKRFLFTYFNGPPDTAGIYAGSIDGAPPVRILPDLSRAVYVPAAGGSRTGHLLFLREDTLMALPFDSDKLRATGALVPLAEELSLAANTGFGAFSASENGVLVYRSGGFSRDRSLVWLDRQGKQLAAVVSEPQELGYPALSPDGKRAAYTIRSSSEVADIWLHDLERGAPTRFTFGGAYSFSPVWSPDGSIVFVRRPRATTYDVYKEPANGTGKEELLLHGGSNATPSDISPDGKLLVYTETEEKTKNDLWLLPLQGEHKPEKYLDSPFDELYAQFSPIGKWMAYASDESGQFQVYVQPIPATGEKHQISGMGGQRPRWRRDGKELFYVAADGKLMAVPVTITGTKFDSGVPQPLGGGSRSIGTNLRSR